MCRIPEKSICCIFKEEYLCFFLSPNCLVLPCNKPQSRWFFLSCEGSPLGKCNQIGVLLTCTCHVTMALICHIWIPRNALGIWTPCRSIGGVYYVIYMAMCNNNVYVFLRNNLWNNLWFKSGNGEHQDDHRKYAIFKWKVAEFAEKTWHGCLFNVDWMLVSVCLDK